MKFLLVALLGLSTFANFEFINCDLKVNTTIEQVAGHAIANGQKVTFFDYDSLRVFVNRKTDTKIEVELFDINGPSRTYAVGDINNSKDSVELAIWTRDILLEVICKSK